MTVPFAQWAAWIPTLASLAMLAWLGRYRRELENWVIWLPLPLVPTMIAVGLDETAWVLACSSALACYCLVGIRSLRRNHREATCARGAAVNPRRHPWRKGAHRSG